MFKALATIGLLVISNSFMTLAWYGNIAFKSRFEKLGIITIILISWCVALAEYSFMIPAMAAILAGLALVRKPLEKEAAV